MTGFFSHFFISYHEPCHRTVDEISFQCLPYCSESERCAKSEKSKSSEIILFLSHWGNSFSLLKRTFLELVFFDICSIPPVFHRMYKHRLYLFLCNRQQYSSRICNNASNVLIYQSFLHLLWLRRNKWRISLKAVFGEEAGNGIGGSKLKSLHRKNVPGLGAFMLQISSPCLPIFFISAMDDVWTTGCRDKTRMVTSASDLLSHL